METTSFTWIRNAFTVMTIHERLKLFKMTFFYPKYIIDTSDFSMKTDQVTLIELNPYPYFFGPSVKQNPKRRTVTERNKKISFENSCELREIF